MRSPWQMVALTPDLLRSHTSLCLTEPSVDFAEKAQLVCYGAVPGLLVEVEVKTVGFVAAD